MVDIKFIHGDCLEEMPKLADKSIDMILCDLPYGTTACKWDVLIPFEPLWKQYKRLIKDNGAIVLTASQPFTSALVMSNVAMFRHAWVWEKTRPANFMSAKYQPMKYHEDVLVFGKGKVTYYPVKTIGNKNHATKARHGKSNIYGLTENNVGIDTNEEKWPSSIIKIKSTDSTQNFHPTQKPVALFEYLIRTYTNEGDTVLDNCAGSGTTGIAAWRQKRNAILIEKDELYFNAAKERFYRETRQVAMF
jgi:site-specific DNA-methyltransferase (adenine-specific)